MGRAAVLLPCVFLLISSPAGAEPVGDPLAVEGGRIRGVDTDVPGVRAYKGIPFAAPPVGDLRWKPPQPVLPWEGVRECSQFGPACPQPDAGVVRTAGKQDEDCLYLNVWTAARSIGEKRPVMVWIHGGGSTVGSASQPFYDGKHFAVDGVMLVSINYRLGPFGFLAHKELSAESPHGVSGNYGTLDQIAALGWVKRNIARFGGDPDNVTIFGESAGAVSCGVLLVSPAAKGLFHRAILESGVPIAVSSRLHDAEAIGETVFRNIGAKTLDEARKKSPEELLGAVQAKVGLLGKGTKYGPIVDGWVIPDYPLKLIDQGKFHNVPLMAGSNADEATMFSGRVAVGGEAGYRALARLAFLDNADAVLELFPPDHAGSPKKTFEEVVTVMSFVSPARMIVRMAARREPDVYLYHFTRVAPLMKLLGKGATHGVEIPYVFRFEGRALRDPTDQALSETMHRCWIQFARTGNPNAPGLPEWPRYDAKSDRHLQFGDTIQTGTALYREACDLFERITREKAGMPAQ